MTSRRHTPAVSRFPFFVEIVETDDCILWPGAKTKAGYGFMNEAGRPKVATHVALEFVGLPRPSLNMFALHSCDNPSCVNPKHLRWGSQSENMIDQLSRGRNPRSVKTHCPQGHAYDDKNTRLSRDGRRACKACHASTKRQQRNSRKGNSEQCANTLRMSKED